MNREIKFRGRVADEPNEWVYGYLLHNNRIHQVEEHEKTKCCGVGIFHVISETIGQYTGLKDKNGVEIYEGDIMENKAGGRGIVKYDNFAEFMLDFDDEVSCTSFNPFVLRRYEVIGNIYEEKK